MKTLAIIQEKGGVAKTTISINLAAALAIWGYRVMFIDTDPQASGTISLGVAPDKKKNVFTLLIDDDDWQSVIKIPNPANWAGDAYPPKGKLAMIGGDLKAYAIPTITRDSMLIRKRLEEIEHAFDWVIFDTSPTAGMTTEMVVKASNYVVIPTQLEELSLHGTANTVFHLSEENRNRNPVLGMVEILGIIPTLTRKTIAHSTEMDFLNEAYGDAVCDEMPLRTVWSEASVERKTIFAYAPQSETCADMWRLFAQLVSKTEVVNG